MSSFKCTGIAAEMLRLDEGYERQPYKDTMGFWTIGVGHFLGKDLHKMALSDRVIRAMLEEDIDNAWADVFKIFGTDAESWPFPRQLALLNLSFNLGGKKLAQFNNTIAAIKDGRWGDAADHLGKSLWAKQVKSRSIRVIHMVRTGELHGDYLPGP
jgi:lysozyme